MDWECTHEHLKILLDDTVAVGLQHSSKQKLIDESDVMESGALPQQAQCCSERCVHLVLCLCCTVMSLLISSPFATSATTLGTLVNSLLKKLDTTESFGPLTSPSPSWPLRLEFLVSACCLIDIVKKLIAFRRHLHLSVDLLEAFSFMSPMCPHHFHLKLCLVFFVVWSPSFPIHVSSLLNLSCCVLDQCVHKVVVLCTALMYSVVFARCSCAHHWLQEIIQLRYSPIFVPGYTY